MESRGHGPIRLSAGYPVPWSEFNVGAEKRQSDRRRLQGARRSDARRPVDVQRSDDIESFAQRLQFHREQHRVPRQRHVDESDRIRIPTDGKVRVRVHRQKRSRLGWPENHGDRQGIFYAYKKNLPRKMICQVVCVYRYRGGGEDVLGFPDR